MNYLDIHNKVSKGEMTPEEGYQAQIKMFQAKLDPRLVSQRTQGGQTLSYIETHQAYQLLNNILGIGNWSFDTIALTETAREKREKNGKDQYVSGYSALCKLTVRFINGTTSSITDVGNGNSLDYQGFHTTTEGAQKEAVSDAFKRCAKSLGNTMGLAWTPCLAQVKFG